jgi:RNA polymerase sigma factor (sigma-70 family)
MNTLEVGLAPGDGVISPGELMLAESVPIDTTEQPDHESGFFVPEQPDEVASPARKPAEIDKSGLDTIGLYKSRMTAELLTAEGEVKLAKRIEAGLLAQTILQIRNHKTRNQALAWTRATLEDEGKTDKEIRSSLKQLGRIAADHSRSDGDFELIANDGDEAKCDLVEANLRLAFKLATRKNAGRKSAGGGAACEDLLQDANLGVIHAVEKFDYAKGFKFSTYASWWIKNYMQGSDSSERIIYLPKGVIEQANKRARCIENLEKDLGRPPTDTEVAKEIGLDIEKYRELVQASAAVARLDQPAAGSDDQNGTLGDFIADENGEDWQEAVHSNLMGEFLEKALLGLTAQQSRIVDLCLGLSSGHPMTYYEIGQELGIAHQTVGAHYRAALRSMQGDKTLIQALQDAA